jgi:hypothetical protein
MKLKGAATQTKQPNKQHVSPCVFSHQEALVAIQRRSLPFFHGRLSHKRV